MKHKMKKYINILIVLIFVSCDFRSSNYYTLEAYKLEEEGKYAEAIILLDKAIEKNPNNIYALMNRGGNKSLLEDYNGAVEDYSKIIAIDSVNTLAYLNRGKNMRRLEKYQEAIEDFEKAIKTKGAENSWIDFPENYLIKGNDFDARVEEIRFERGLARYGIDSLRMAFDDFYFCIRCNFALPGSYYMLGMIYIEYGYIDDACVVLHKSRMLGNLNAQEMIDKYCGK